MINNRQGGRRRGRGGQRNQSLGGRPDGNRQDNRQRGNAAQLLEKYKNMARDSQLAGDRVQAEYYLQFADHYFRVLGESRSRFEDQRPQRSDEMDDDDDGEELEADGDNSGDDYESEEAPRAERSDNRDRQRRPRYPREDGGREFRNGEMRADRSEARPDRSEPRQDRSEPRPDRSEVRSERPAPRRREEPVHVNGSGESGIALEVLPPAIGAIEAIPNDDLGEAERPRRRTRRPRPASDEGEIAPAA